MEYIIEMLNPTAGKAMIDTSLLPNKAENSRYFDLRRWKDAEYEESQQMYGCNAYMSKKERDLFHTQVINSNLPTTFSRKMYFWPISHDQLRRNLRLTQNPGWTYYD